MAPTEQLADVCADIGLTIASKLARNQTREGWGAGSVHWTCTLSYAPKSGAKSRSITTPFSQDGPQGVPEVADVLYCLLSDASTVRDSMNIDDYAQQYCEGVKLSRVLSLWRSGKRMDAKLAKFLGEHRERCERAEH